MELHFLVYLNVFGGSFSDRWIVDFRLWGKRCIVENSQFHTSEYSARIRKSNYFSQLCQFMQVQFHGFVSGSTKNSGCLLGYEFSLFRYPTRYITPLLGSWEWWYGSIRLSIVFHQNVVKIRRNSWHIWYIDIWVSPQGEEKRNWIDFHSFFSLLVLI